VALTEDRSIGVEQDVNAAILQVSDHPGQVRDQHRLADAVQNRPREIGDLIDNRHEQLPAHVCRRLEFLVGARTGGAQQIAAVGHFQIEADRRSLGDLGALARNRFVIAARVERRVRVLRFARKAHCTIPASVVRGIRVLQATKAQASNNPPNRIDLVTILGMYKSQSSCSDNNNAAIETNHVGAEPHRATNGVMIRKYQG
jgi:hypothetical protein